MIPSRAYHEETLTKQFVGHVRLAADGAPEFATGWNDVDAPRGRISVASHPTLRASRWWFDAYATSSRDIPFAIEPCRCGAKRPMPPLGRAVKPFTKPSAR
jgi:hypothetical protein